MDMHLSSMTKEELVARQDRLSITVTDLNIADTPTGGSGGALPPKQIKGCLKRSSDLKSSPSLPPTEFSRRYSGGGGGGGGDANRSSGSVVSASSSSKMQMIRSRSRERAQQLHDLAVAQEVEERAAAVVVAGANGPEYATRTANRRRGSIATSNSTSQHHQHHHQQHHRGRGRMKPSAAKADARAKIHAARVRSRSRERDFAAAVDAAEAAADVAAAGPSSPRRRSGDHGSSSSSSSSSSKRAEEEMMVQQLQRQLEDQVRGRVNRRGSMASRASCGGSVVSMGDRSIRSIGSACNDGGENNMEKRADDKLPTVRRSRRRSSLAAGGGVNGIAGDKGAAAVAADPPGRRRSSLFQDTDSDDAEDFSGNEVVIPSGHHGHYGSSGHLSGLSGKGNMSRSSSGGHLSRGSLQTYDIDVNHGDVSASNQAQGHRRDRRKEHRRSSSLDETKQIASLLDDVDTTGRRNRGDDGHSVSTEKVGNQFVDDLQQLVKEAQDAQQKKKSSSRRSSRSSVEVGEKFLSELNDAGQLNDVGEVVKKTRQPRRGSIQAAQKQLMDDDAKRYGVERPPTSDAQLQSSEWEEQQSRQPRQGSIQAAQKQMAEDDTKRYDAVGNERRRASRRSSDDSGKRERRRSRSSDRALEMLSKSVEGDQIEMDVVFDYRADSDGAKPLAAMSKSFDETEIIKPHGVIPRSRSRTAMDIAMEAERGNQALERRSSGQRRRRSRSVDRTTDLADQLAREEMQENTARRRSRSSERSGDIMAQLNTDSKRRDERRAERRRSRSAERSNDLMEQIDPDYRGRGDERNRMQRRRSRSMDKSSDILAQIDGDGRESRRSSRSHVEVDGLSSQIDLKPLPSKDKRGRRKSADRPADITAHLAKLHAPQLAKLDRGLPRDRSPHRRSMSSERSKAIMGMVDGGRSSDMHTKRSRSRDRFQNVERALGEPQQSPEKTRERRRSRSIDRSLDIQKMIIESDERDRRGQWLDAHPKTRDRNVGTRRRSSSVDRTKAISELVDDDFAREVGGATILRGGLSGGSKASAYFTDPLYQLQLKEKKGIKKKIKNVIKGK